MATNLAALRQGFETAFIDGSLQSNPDLQPQFVSNDYKQGRKVISSIEEELLACDEFAISVAFINMKGIEPLLQTLKELEDRNICGKILTTDYLYFTEPKALKKLAEFKNITLKMYFTENAPDGFHTKGYIFKNKGIYRIITGSSNMTQSALTKNREWNTKIVSTEQGEYAQEILNEFQYLWNSQYALNYGDAIDRYIEKYRVIKKQREIAKKAEVTSLEAYRLQPNKIGTCVILSLMGIATL